MSESFEQYRARRIAELRLQLDELPADRVAVAEKKISASRVSRPELVAGDVEAAAAVRFTGASARAPCRLVHPQLRRHAARVARQPGGIL